MKKIKFLSNRSWLNENSVSRPKPISKFLPDWYKDGDRFLKLPSGEYPTDPIGGKVPTWKACPAVYDTLGTGYTYLTPYDIEVKRDADGNPEIVDPEAHIFPFIHPRGTMPGFPVPAGYDEIHFAWWPDWAVELPSGYSAMYVQPINRFDLPFFSTGGIIDNDKVALPGTVPFFIQKDFVGIIPEGTPFLQIIPFKRENWEAEYEYNNDHRDIINKNYLNAQKYRVPNGGVYLNQVWQRRTYK